jgi:alkylation response protein AidB-like acyl-CoA dehydrogenase
MVTTDHGGSGLGIHEMAVVLEELGRVAAPEPLTACAVLAAKVVSLSDQPPIQQTLLQGLAAGTLIPAVAWQESHRLQGVDECRTHASRDGAGWLLQGAKCFVRPGSYWDGVILSAATHEGLALFWVPGNSAGLTVTPKALADSSPCADVLLADVRVGPDQLLATPKVAAAALSHALDFARLATAAELLGVIRGALAMSIEYLRTREQFGVVIGSFQALRHRVVELFLQQELVSAALEEACRLADSGATGTELATIAARVKARASAAALQVTKDSVQFHGAMGYTDECDVGLYLKRALTLSSWLGTASELLASQSRSPASSSDM